MEPTEKSRSRSRLVAASGPRKTSVPTWLQLLVFALLFVSTFPSSARAEANSIWVKLSLDRQPFPEVEFLLAKHHHSTLGGQTYTVRIKNVSGSRVKVVGTLVAELTCGNLRQINFDVDVKPGHSVGGESFLTDTLGLSGEIFKEDCAGENLPDPSNPQGHLVNRIRHLRLTNLRLTNLDQQEEQVRQEQENRVRQRAENERLRREESARELRRQEAAEARANAGRAARERVERIESERQQQNADLQRTLDQAKEDINRTLTRESRPEAAKECGGCNGTGMIACVGCAGLGTVPGFPKPLPCAVCNRRGRIPCFLCSGTGKKN